MSEKTVKTRVFELICTQVDLPEVNFDEGNTFIEDLGFDSLDTIELVMACEEEFDIPIEDSVASEMQTPKNLIDYIEGFLAGQKDAKT